MSNENILRDLSLRHLRATYFVANKKSISAAATHLNRTQTAITKSINSIEALLDQNLFTRTPVGMVPNVFGEAIANRVGAALQEFEKAGRLWQEQQKNHTDFRNVPLFSMDIGTKRVLSFIRVCELRSIINAAAAVGQTRAGINNSIRTIESALNMRLFERSNYGLEPTALCLNIVKHLKLAFVQLRNALEDIDSLNNAATGHVKIGTLPYTRTLLVPRSINRILERHPELKLSTQEGSYQNQTTALLCGDLDFIVGAIRKHDEQDELITETLTIDNLAVIARTDHPLANKKKVSIKDLMSLDWVLPGNSTPTRALFEELYQAHQLQPPEHFIECSSLVIMRGILIESDRVALLSKHQVYFEVKEQMLTTLAVDLENTMRPIGVTMRKHSEHSPAMKLFLNELRKVAEEI